jgi:Rrf2 family transcriptional regulator, iron-sulfur cluster assembly transcription factor
LPLVSLHTGMKSSSRALEKETVAIVRRSFSMLLSRKGLFAIAAVVDVASQKDNLPISAKTLAARHGLPWRHLEPVLQSLVRDGILKGVRGPHGGYRLACDHDGLTANDILRAAGTDKSPDEKPKSPLIADVVLPLLSAVEEECGQALSRIRLDDMVNRAATNGGVGTRPKDQREPRAS